MTNSQTSHAFAWLVVLACTLLAGALLALTPSTSGAQDAGEEWKVDPMRGPVDLGLTDPSLIGAIDIHVHVDPDAPGTSGVIRAIDVIEAVNLAKARGMRGFVFKTHQDAGSAGAAYLMRKHVAPGFEVFGHSDPKHRVGTVSFRCEMIPASDLGAILDQSFDIAIRPGLHCAPYIHKAVGSYPDGLVRVSTGPFNTTAEIDRLAEALKEVTAGI